METAGPLSNFNMKLISPWLAWGRQALGLLSPPACPACGRPAGRHGLAMLCAQCCPRIGARPCCQACGQWLAATPMLRISRPVRCRDCRPLRLYFERARSLAPYAQAWRQAILAFKTLPAGDLAYQLAALCSRFIRAGYLTGSWSRIIPVPHRPGRTPHAAHLLAKKLADRLQIKFYPKLRFQRRTAPQHTLPRKIRLKNLRRSMTWKGAPLSGEACLVIDDVYTTGATVNECARVLKAQGAGRVDVLTLARSPGPNSLEQGPGRSN